MGQDSSTPLVEGVHDAEVTIQKRIDNTDFERLKVIGQGQYGTVMLVRKRDGVDKSQLYAMKIIQKDYSRESSIMLARSEREIMEIIKNSPYVVKLRYAFQTSSKFHLIMDYHAGGALRLYMHKRFDVYDVSFYVGEIVLALEYLHNLGIVHCDLKPDNILLNKEGHIVLCDFGCSNNFIKQDDGKGRFFGTLRYMAPEKFCASHFDRPPVDWWSLGIITHEMLLSVTPFGGNRTTNDQEVIRQIQEDQPSIPLDIPQCVGYFIIDLLKKNPQERLGSAQGAYELKTHPFLLNMCWELLEDRKLAPPMIPSMVYDTDNVCESNNLVEVSDQFEEYYYDANTTESDQNIPTHTQHVNPNEPERIDSMETNFDANNNTRETILMINNVSPESMF